MMGFMCCVGPGLVDLLTALLGASLLRLALSGLRVAGFGATTLDLLLSGVVCGLRVATGGDFSTGDICAGFFSVFGVRLMGVLRFRGCGDN